MLNIAWINSFFRHVLMRLGQNTYGPGCEIMRKLCVLLLFCILFSGSSGCTGSSPETPVVLPPVFSNGSVVTEDPWISMNPVGDHDKGAVFTLSGSTNLPAKSIIQVIIVQSGPSAAKIRIMDDCITERQKCVVYFAKATGNNTGVNHWNITTDESLDVFRSVSSERYTAIVENIAGDLSARSEFGLR